MISPKWKNFRSQKLQFAEKTRLNNAIWRCWHIQCEFLSTRFFMFLFCWNSFTTVASTFAFSLILWLENIFIVIGWETVNLLIFFYFQCKIIHIYNFLNLIINKCSYESSSNWGYAVLMIFYFFSSLYVKVGLIWVNFKISDS